MKRFRSSRRFAPLALALIATLATAATPAPRLRVDPRLLVELETVRGVIAGANNPVWPGWNAADTPVLIYLPGVQDVLIDHPSPPAGFVPVATPPGTPAAWRVLAKDGPTLITWDGQNTSRDVNGVSTLVVADNLSNLRQQIRGWLEDPRSADETLADLDLERDLAPDVTGEMATIAHEAFHVFQTRSAPGRGADERDVRVYPCLSVDNNVGFALEGRALAEVMRAPDERTARAAALRWLAVREKRRAALPSRAIAYEDGNEFMEGLAKYVELGLFRALEGAAPDPRLFGYQGFRGFGDLAGEREKRIRSLVRHMAGEVNVNNDLYGASPLRMRLYFSGMAIASLLDRFAPDWKARIFQPGATLTGLARDALSASPAELRRGWDAARSDTGHASLVRAKTDLARRGKSDTDSLLAAIWNGRGPTLELDWSALATDAVSLSFTPFGVRAVDSLKTIYTLVPIGAALGSSKNGFEQATPRPTFEDRGAKRFAFALDRALNDAERAAVASAAGESLRVELPGATLFAKRAVTEVGERRILVRFLP